MTFIRNLYLCHILISWDFLNVFSGMLQTCHTVPGFYYCLTSGNPATDVSTDTMPASTAVDTVSVQFTPPNAVAAPIPPMAACAVVFTARMPAAFNHFLFFSFNIVPPPYNPKCVAIKPKIMPVTAVII